MVIDSRTFNVHTNSLVYKTYSGISLSENRFSSSSYFAQMCNMLAFNHFRYASVPVRIDKPS
jgi:hypothetical protein